MSVPRADERHYWFPVPVHGTGGTRHAFQGRRWDGAPTAVTTCGATVPMAQPSELDWIMAASCEDCRKTLVGEKP